MIYLIEIETGGKTETDLRWIWIDGENPRAATFISPCLVTDVPAAAFLSAAFAILAPRYRKNVVMSTGWRMQFGLVSNGTAP